MNSSRIRTLTELADALIVIAEELDTNYGPQLAREDYDTYDRLNALDEFIGRLKSFDRNKAGRVLLCPDPTHHHNDGCYECRR